MAYHSAENRRTPPVFSADHKRGDSLFAMTTGEWWVPEVPLCQSAIPAGDEKVPNS